MKGKKETKERKGRKGKKEKNAKEKKEMGKNGKTQKRRGKSGFIKSEKQNVPATCTADKCSDKDYVNLFNAYKKVIISNLIGFRFIASFKNDNMLRQLQRLVRFFDLIRKKANSALTTFQPAAEAISAATADCSTCK